MRLSVSRSPFFADHALTSGDAAARSGPTRISG
jgi:hypothetical protein